MDMVVCDGVCVEGYDGMVVGYDGMMVSVVGKMMVWWCVWMGRRWDKMVWW